MFSGIISHLGEVVAIAGESDKQISIRLPSPPLHLRLGDSVACNGVCLTATALDNGVMRVDASAETLACTTVGLWQVGEVLHLEYALRLGDGLDGHLVAGHVDGLGQVTSVLPMARSYSVTLKPDSNKLMKLIAPKGSIAVDGVSLTVNTVTQSDFSVMIIPHTWAVTRFKNYQPGTRVNLEIDLLARYVARCLEWRAEV